MSDFINITPDSVRVLFEKGTYFGNDSIYALPGRPAPGAEGILVPYSAQQDPIVTLILVVSFMLVCLVFKKAYPVILHQLKDFFQERERNNMFVERNKEFRYQIPMLLLTCLMLGLLVYRLQFQNIFPYYMSFAN